VRPPVPKTAYGSRTSAPSEMPRDRVICGAGGGLAVIGCHNPPAADEGELERTWRTPANGLKTVGLASAAVNQRQSQCR